MFLTGHYPARGSDQDGIYKKKRWKSRVGSGVCQCVYHGSGRARATIGASLFRLIFFLLNDGAL